MFVFGLFLGASVLRDLMDGPDEAYGGMQKRQTYDWQSGGFGIRGTPPNWRDDNPQFGWGMNMEVARPGLGMRGPTSSFRYPLPRPWERLPPLDAETVSARPHTRFGEDEYGVLTGAGGIRGVPTFQSFTPAQIAAYNREGAAQGLRGGSVAPPG